MYENFISPYCLLEIPYIMIYGLSTLKHHTLDPENKA